MVKEPRRKTRCGWAETDPLLRDYYDNEWGIPEHDSRALWEGLRSARQTSDGCSRTLNRCPGP